MIIFIFTRLCLKHDRIWSYWEKQAKRYSKKLEIGYILYLYLSFTWLERSYGPTYIQSGYKFFGMWPIIWLLSYKILNSVVKINIITWKMLRLNWKKRNILSNENKLKDKTKKDTLKTQETTNLQTYVCLTIFDQKNGQMSL